MKFKKHLLTSLLVLTSLTLAACSGESTTSKDTGKSNEPTSSKVVKHKSSDSDKTNNKDSKPQSQKSKNDKTKSNNKEILAKLVTYTDNESAGPTKDYYYENGNANLTGFSDMKSGDYKFSSDTQGRASTAKAVLNYDEYSNSKGSRQGSPLDPFAWPSNNPIVAITYGLTGRTYHGYIYNRSHSIGDSLLGEHSYDSENNFTTGTRPQNVGADQNGGMRYAEELVENYWNNHPNTNNTVSYETTPLYKDTETMPRGSVVDIKSSDGSINKEIVIINSVEGINVNYSDGSNDAKSYVKPATKHKAKKNTTQNNTHSSSSTSNYNKSDSSYNTPTNDDTKSTYSNESDDASTSDNSSSKDSDTSSNSSTGQTTEGKWTVAEAGMVYYRTDSHKYYAKVTNPTNYQYVSEESAINDGGKRAPHGNQYAQPYLIE